MKFSDFPQDLQDKIKTANPRDFDFLRIDAWNAREEDQAAEYPTDAIEALNAVFEFRRQDHSISIDDPLEFVADAIDVVCQVLGQEEDRCFLASWQMLNTASDALRSYTTREEEIKKRLRVAWLHQRDK